MAEDIAAEYEAFAEYITLNPPHCIRELSKPALKGTQHITLTFIGKFSWLFGAQCPCGCEDFTIEFEGMISLVCVQCGYRIVIFNPNRDGNRIANGILPTEIDETYSEYHCNECGHHAAKITTGYQFESAFNQYFTDTAIRIKPENRFERYALYAGCANCGFGAIVFQAEC